MLAAVATVGPEATMDSPLLPPETPDSSSLARLSPSRAGHAGCACHVQAGIPRRSSQMLWAPNTPLSPRQPNFFMTVLSACSQEGNPSLHLLVYGRVEPEGSRWQLVVWVQWKPSCVPQGKQTLSRTRAPGPAVQVGSTDSLPAKATGVMRVFMPRPRSPAGCRVLTCPSSHPKVGSCWAWPDGG